MLLVDLSPRSLSVFQIEDPHKSEKLDFFGSSEIYLSQWDESEGDQILASLDNILSGHQLVDETVCVLMRPDNMISQEVFLPYINNSDLRHMVRFEVQKISQEPMDAVLFRYEILERPELAGDKARVLITVLSKSKIRFLKDIFTALGLKLISIKDLSVGFVIPESSFYEKEVFNKLKDKHDYVHEVPFYRDAGFIIKVIAVSWLILFFVFVAAYIKYNMDISRSQDEMIKLSIQTKELDLKLSEMRGADEEASTYYIDTLCWVRENLGQGIWLGKLRMEEGNFEIMGWGDSKEAVDDLILTLNSKYKVEVLYADWEQELYKFRVTAQVME
ncbi:MAG: hypothetical protein V1843_01570 [bacterium]